MQGAPDSGCWLSMVKSRDSLELEVGLVSNKVAPLFGDKDWWDAEVHVAK
jgi:hypothetical protein